MRKAIVLAHEFVEYIPKDLKDGIVYVSITFATAVHQCCCGCGNKVVTPLSPTDWQLIYDGDSISLYPSIGNWGFPCRSHYWIVRNRIEWARPCSRENIEAGRQRDQHLTDRYYARDNPPATDKVETSGKTLGKVEHKTKPRHLRRKHRS